ncbi:hypothetical protein Bca4012_075714 [Brassica carinata]
MINNLPDDLLVQILLHVPIKDAVSTMILSKRWRSIWTMLPALDYDDSDIDGESKSIWYFIDKSMQLHKTPVLQNLYIELGPGCPVVLICPILRNLYVVRRNEDNVTNFNVKISFLETLVYVNEYKEDFEDSNGSLVINSPTLKTAIICDYSGDSFLIENKCFLDKASIKVLNHLGDGIRIFISSLIRLDVLLNNPTMDQDDDFPISWHHPGSVPKCLLTNLEIFEWKEYGGKFEEKELVKYIFANSRCLKRAAISIRSKCILEGKEKTMVDELESMPRISESHALMFETVIDWRDIYRKGFNAAMW